MDPKVFAVVAHVVDLARVGVDAPPAILDHRIVLPAGLPQLVAHRQILVANVVALVVFGQARLAETPPGALQVGGHDIPGDAALGQMVEGRDGSGKGKRVALQDRAGKGKAEMLGRIGHGRNQHHGIVDRDLGRLAQGRLAVVAVHVVDPDHVGQKQRIEFAPLQQLGQINPGVEVGVAVHLVVGMHPQSGRLMDDTVHMEGVEVDTFVHRRFLSGVQTTSSHGAGAVKT